MINLISRTKYSLISFQEYKQCHRHLRLIEVFCDLQVATESHTLFFMEMMTIHCLNPPNGESENQDLSSFLQFSALPSSMG